MTTNEQRAGEHPRVETLVAYHRSDLAAEKAERVADHLSLCAHCARLLLDLDGFSEPDSERLDEPGQEEVDRAWRALEEKLPEDIVRPVRAPSPAIWGRLAASLALVVIGFGAGALWNRPSRDALEPAVNVPIVDLFPERSTRAGGSPEPMELRPDDGFVLVLNLEADEGETHDLEIVDESGHEVWRSVGASPDPFGGYTLALARSALGEGEFRILVKASGATEPIAEFAFSVASSG